MLICFVLFIKLTPFNPTNGVINVLGEVGVTQPHSYLVKIKRKFPMDHGEIKEPFRGSFSLLLHSS